MCNDELVFRQGDASGRNANTLLRARACDATVHGIVVASLHLEPSLEHVQGADEDRGEGARHAAGDAVHHDRVVQLAPLQGDEPCQVRSQGR